MRAKDQTRRGGEQRDMDRAPADAFGERHEAFCGNEPRRRPCEQRRRPECRHRRPDIREYTDPKIGRRPPPERRRNPKRERDERHPDKRGGAQSGRVPEHVPATSETGHERRRDWPKSA